MRRLSTRGGASLSAALPLALWGTVAAVLSSGSAADAVTKPRPSDTCAALSGDIVTAKLSRCKSDPDREMPKESERNGTGTITFNTPVTITWDAPFEGGGVINVSFLVATLVGNPGQPADENERAVKSCPAGTQEFELTGNVGPGDDAGGVLTAEVCLDQTGHLTLEPGTVLTISQPPGAP